MSLDRVIDPVSGDYSGASRGRFATCEVLQNKIVLSYSFARGAWEGDPELGHRFDELERAPNDAGTLQRLRDLIVDAVDWLLKSGELASVNVVDVERFGDSFLAWEAEFYPPGRQDPIEIGRRYVRIGGEG